MRYPFQRSASAPLTSIRPAKRRTTKNPLRVEALEKRQLLAADVLQITVENLSDETGLASTPFWIAAHDGNFNLADLGSPASGFGGIELIAEEGDPSELVTRFGTEGVGNDGVITAPDGFAGAPVFEAGESVTQQFNVDESLNSQYFSFASMVIPSNDAFIGNLNPRAYRIYDDAGEFLGPQTIVVYGSQIWDAGTEVNDPAGGPAFVVGGGTSADENGVVTQHAGLDDFLGVDLPTGETLGRAFGANTPIARITIAQAANPSSPIDSTGPQAVLQANDLNQRADFHQLTVVYSDASGIDLNSISASNLRITGPTLTQLEVLSVQTDAVVGTTPREVVATYRVAPVSGSFTDIDNGTYSIVLLDNQVNDPFDQAAVAQLLGDFTVDVPVRLNVTFEALTPDGGLSQTPVFVSAHDGNFEIARAGSTASNFGGLELIAEEGDPSELVARFEATSSGNAAVILAPDGFAGAPIFEPGETVTQTLEVSDPLQNRFFSYASMVIPSNDAFIANLDPRAYTLFDADGEFTGARSFTIYGRDIWDAGTEVNAVDGEAAFSTQGGTPVDENGVIRRHSGLNDFIGSGTPTGTLDSAFGNRTPIARFTISLADAPADPIDHQAPLHRATANAVIATGTNTTEVSVTYYDASGVNIASIDVDDIQVRGLQGDPLVVTSATTDVAVGEQARTVTATYTIANANGESFSTLDNGLYTVSLNEGEVADVLGNQVAADSLTSLEVFVPVQLTITVENLSAEGGLAQTPFWVGVHEGNFQVARGGVEAAEFDGLEDLAEEGDVSGVVSRFASESSGVDTVILAPDGFAGAPVFEPGEVVSQTLSILNTDVNRYFSFASMLIPSNDAFFANLNPRAYRLFDANGFFLGPQTITLTGRDVYDAGTEVNGVGAGAAFSAEGGDGIDENGVIRRHSGLDDFIGSGLPTGESLLSAFDADTPLARITISLADGVSAPIDQQGPTARVSADDVLQAGVASHEIQVTYNDPSGIDPSSIGTGDLLITGPLGRQLQVTNVVTDAADGATPNTVTATYTVTTADGEFSARDNGRYEVNVLTGEVTDAGGRSTASPSAGDFRVDVGIRLQVEIESLSLDSGLSQTPFWVGFHDGGFEVARSGASAAEFGGLELIAEEGDPSELVARFIAESNGTGAVITAPDGFAGAPVLEPGEITSQVIEVTNSRENRFFSYASMVIPSNDAFVANRDGRAHELFDASGNFRGERKITIYGRDILDAGTEVNDPNGGAAFSIEGGTSTDEGGVIRKHAGLDDFVDTATPTGTLAFAFSDLVPIATITISLFDPEGEICTGVDGACSVRSVSLQNASLTADVNRDGEVSPLDALLVLNFLSDFGDRSTITDEAQATGLALDVGGDQTITPSDALSVLNELANQFAPQQPSGEQIENVDAAFSQLIDDGFLEEDEDARVDELAGVLF